MASSITDDHEDSAMDIDHRVEDEQEDPFLQFIDYAKLVLSPDQDESIGPGWSWIASRILKMCTAYSSGVTAAILLSDLSQVRPVVDFSSICVALFMNAYVGLIDEPIYSSSCSSFKARSRYVNKSSLNFFLKLVKLLSQAQIRHYMISRSRVDWMSYTW